MTEVTTDTQLGAAMAPADAVPDFLVAMDAKYADSEYMAAMDASSANLAHQAGTAAAGWAGTSVEKFARDAVSHADHDMPPGAFQGSTTVMTGYGAANTISALPIELIPVEALRLDGGTQSRVAINEEVIAEYAASLSAGELLPPVVVFFDGVAFWLADGFHRFHAYQAAGVVDIPGHIHSGTRRDAVLYSVGANRSHGLPRTNEDKRKAVSTLLSDPEWMGWSNIAIAKACGVSDRFVGLVRTAISETFGDSASDQAANSAPIRTVERNGKTYAQKTEKIGKTRKAKAASAPQTDDPFLDVAPPRLTPEQGSVTVASLEELLAENAALREELASTRAKLAETLEELDDIKSDMAETLEDNEMMGRVFDADDPVKAAMAEATRHKALMENAERTLSARSHEFNERARNILYWKNRAEKAEKKLAKALVAAGHPVITSGLSTTSP